MISRVADHCFWLGRYVERAESTARALQATRNLALDAGLAPSQCWRPAVVVSGEEREFVRRFGDVFDDGETVQSYLAWDPDNLSSIRRSLEAARENARSIREVVSRETWEEVNALYHWIASDEATALWREDRDAVYRHIRHACHIALAYAQSSMLHEDAYHFIVLGVMLERAGQTARLLDVHHHAFTRSAVHEVLETAVSLALLRACSGIEAFMKRTRGPVNSLAVASFLVLDPGFPQSVRFSIASAYRRLQLLRPAGEPGRPGGAALEKLAALEAWVVRLTPAAVQSHSIHATLTHVVDEMAVICDALGRELFGGAPAVQMQESQ